MSEPRAPESLPETAAQGLYEYFQACPLLARARLGVDFLPETVGAYSISVDPAPQAVRRYTDGGSLRQLEFTLSGRESYGPETLQQLENSGFYQRLGQWMEERSQAGLLPALPEGQKAAALEALSAGSLTDQEGESARYQIHCRLTYTQAAGKGE